MAKQTFTTGQILSAAQMTSLQQTAMLGGAASAKTASYTLVAADAGTAITMNSASATTITVNTALFAAGDTVQIINIGAGVCTITAGTATVSTSSSLALAQYDGGALDFISTSASIFLKSDTTAASSGFDAVYSQELSGYYIRQQSSNLTLGTFSPVANVTWYIPLFISTQSFDRIAIKTQSTFSGSSTIRLGLYNASTTTGKPTTVNFDAGTVVATAASTVYEITISKTIASGWYYLAFNVQSIAGTSDFNNLTCASSILPGVMFMGATAGATVSLNFFSETGITGAFATAGTLVAPVQTGPQVSLRIV